MGGSITRPAAVLSGVGSRYASEPAKVSVEDTYDYIVVGAGTSGCVLANRLSARPSFNVLVLEAGDDAIDWDVSVPAAALSLQKTDRDWQYQTVPQKHACGNYHDRKSNWPRGKCLGGTSSINSMVYARGVRENYDGWQLSGCDGWSYDDVLPFFRKSQHQTRPALRHSPYHGTGGELTTSDLRYTHEITHAFIAAAQLAGVPANVDYNGETALGVSRTQTTTNNGARWSTADAFLAPVASRSNLTIATRARVTRLIWSQGAAEPRVVGVAFRRGSTVSELRASKEIIVCARIEVALCAGAVSSPHLLMLSGIGPKDLLSEHGIPCYRNLPVGHNLQDQVSVTLPFDCTEPCMNQTTGNASNVTKYAMFKDGPLASSGVEAIAYISTATGTGVGPASKANKAEPVVDASIQLFVSSGGDALTTVGNLKPEHHVHISNGFLMQATLLRPKSRGKLSLLSTDPFNQPLIDPCYLEHPNDVDILLGAIRTCEHIAQQPPMKRYLVGGRTKAKLPIVPGGEKPGGVADVVWQRYIHDNSRSGCNPGGGCRMGKEDDETTVVTPELKVLGVRGLRVADSSIFPTLPSADTTVAAVLVGEKAASLMVPDELYDF